VVTAKGIPAALRWSAVGVVALIVGVVGLVSTRFVLGDSGPAAVLGMLLPVLVPVAAATFLAARWPATGTWVLGGLVVLAAAWWVWYAVDPGGWSQVNYGSPLGAPTLLLAIPLAVLGLRRPIPAGLLLLAVALLPYLAYLPTLSGQPFPGLATSLADSSTILTPPALLAGILLLVAALLPTHTTADETQIATHPAVGTSTQRVTTGPSQPRGQG
jgi:hypothetical protein